MRSIHKSIKLIATIAVALVVAACQSVPKNVLSEAEVRSLKVVDVEVTVPVSQAVRWGRFQREQQRIAEGKPLDGGSVTTASFVPEENADPLFPTVEQHRETMLIEPVKTLVKEQLDEIMTGERPVRAEIQVHKIVIVGAAQAALLGGASNIEATTTLYDVNTNSVITAYAPTTAQSGYAPGGLLGVVVGEAGSLNKYEKTVKVYAANLRNWLIPRNDPVE